MTQVLVSVGFFVVLLALIPPVLKWVQRRSAGSLAGATTASRIVSAVAVGQHQRVVTVEVGPEGDRVWLTLGVTAQTISCLHSAKVSSGSEVDLSQTIETKPILM